MSSSSSFSSSSSSSSSSSFSSSSSSSSSTSSAKRSSVNAVLNPPDSELTKPKGASSDVWLSFGLHSTRPGYAICRNCRKWLKYSDGQTSSLTRHAESCKKRKSEANTTVSELFKKQKLASDLSPIHEVLTCSLVMITVRVMPVPLKGLGGFHCSRRSALVHF